ISGKLTSARHRTEKYTAGIMPKSGDPALKYIKVGKATILLKPGIYGIKVKIYPPDAPMPEEIRVVAREPGEMEVVEFGERGEGAEGKE
ncbi:MAG: 30S ribosomal protein S3, partial [Nitrososphaerota archaeon]